MTAVAMRARFFQNIRKVRLYGIAQILDISIRRG
jgi:hypothetical protein